MTPPGPDLTRRLFLQGSGMALAGAAALGARADTDEKPIPKVPTSVLGRTGAEVGKLGIGCAYFGMRQHITPKDVAATLHRCLELGINYLDTAPTYGDEKTGFAETKMGPVMKEIRDRVFLVTKTEDPTYEGTWKLLRQSLERLQTDHVDLVHLHNFGDNRDWWKDVKAVFGPKGAVGALREARAQGLVRFIGASGHLHPSQFHAALDTGEIDVLMNAVNFIVRHTYDFEHKVWARARRDNIGLVAMKVLGGAPNPEGGFAIPAEYYDRAIRYALGVPGLSCAVIGMASIEEVEQAARVVATAPPLSEAESLELARAGLELARSASWKEVYGTPVT